MSYLILLGCQFPTFGLSSYISSMGFVIYKIGLRATCINVRPEIFYKKKFDYNSLAICLISTKLSHHTIACVTISCV